MWPLASVVQTTPLLSTSIPRGLKLPGGGWKISVSPVLVGSGPGMKRIRYPAWSTPEKPMPIDWPQIEPSVGLGCTA